MKFFEAQKRAAFAAKLFASAGFDFDAAVAKNDEAAFKAFLSAQGGDPYKAMFATAGLNAEQMVANGPDALKLHIESLDDSDALSSAEAKVSSLEGKLNKANDDLTAASKAAKAAADAIATAGATIGFAFTADTKPEAFTAALDSHIKKQAALELAKGGHPPVPHTPPKAEGKDAPINPDLKGRDRYAADFDRQLTAMAQPRR